MKWMSMCRRKERWEKRRMKVKDARRAEQASHGRRPKMKTWYMERTNQEKRWTNGNRAKMKQKRTVVVRIQKWGQQRRGRPPSSKSAIPISTIGHRVSHGRRWIDRRRRKKCEKCAMATIGKPLTRETETPQVRTNDFCEQTGMGKHRPEESGGSDVVERNLEILPVSLNSKRRRSDSWVTRNDENSDII